MKYIIGLGNPGVKYQKNRHNAGRLFIEELGARIKNQGSFLPLKTNVFMNESGVFVVKTTRTYNLEPSCLYIAHDDLDIPLGQYKIQFGVGPKVHNGILSVENELGTKDFWRIRIGIDNRNDGSHAAEASRGINYVLEDFTSEELEILKKVYEKIRNDLIRI